MKNRAQDFLAEVALLREQGIKEGSIDVTRLPPMSKVRAVAVSLLGDINFDRNCPDHIDIYLYLVAMHLHGNLSPGKTRQIPVDNYALLQMISDILARGIKQWNPIVREISTNAKLAGCTQNAVRAALSRALETAIEGRLILTRVKKAKLNRMLPELTALKASIPRRRRLK